MSFTHFWVQVSEEISYYALTIIAELIIEDFDEEQVWAGVEMLNKAKFAEFSGKVGCLRKSLDPGGCQCILCMFILNIFSLIKNVGALKLSSYLS